MTHVCCQLFSFLNENSLLMQPGPGAFALSLLAAFGGGFIGGALPRGSGAAAGCRDDTVFAAVFPAGATASVQAALSLLVIGFLAGVIAVLYWGRPAAAEAPRAAPAPAARRLTGSTLALPSRVSDGPSAARAYLAQE